MRRTAQPRRWWYPPLLRPAVQELACLVLALALTHPASAQTPGSPIISVTPTIRAEPSTQVPFPIRTRSAPPKSFVRVRGLPPRAALSAGHLIARGSWAVPLNALPDLKVVLPAATRGNAQVIVALVRLDGSVLGESRCTLVISGAPAPMAEDRKRALRFQRKGHEQLAQGLVASARLLYERAAELGLAESAMALAATYDDAELKQRRLNVQPDAAKARHWYRRALALGAPEAEQRLRRLRED